MAKHYTAIPPFVAEWLLKQKMFWVASAPLGEDGLINLSPKSIPGTFHIVDERTVWYEDLTGSGTETIAHIRENGRITVMFHAFDGPPNIVRLWGKGKVHEFGTPAYEALLPPESRTTGSRSVIMIDVHKVGTMCGYGIPFYEFKGHRTKLLDFALRLESFDEAAKFSDDPTLAKKGLKAYWAKANMKSLDGLPGVRDSHLVDIQPTSSPNSGRGTGSVVADDSPDAAAPKKVSSRWMSALVQRRRSKLYSLGQREDLRLLGAFTLGLILAALFFRFEGTARVALQHYT